MGRDAIVLSPHEGKPLTFIGITTVVKVFSAESGGAYSLIESTVSPHFEGFKPHVHHQMTEAFYLLDGMLTFRLDDRTFDATPGSFILVPPGVRHSYWNPTDTPARYLLLMSPGGFEQYLIKLAKMIQTEPVWPPQDMTRLNALAEKYDAMPPQ